MQITPAILPDMIQAVDSVIAENARQVTALDQELGDGDHVINLQRGLQALKEQAKELVVLDWAAALQKMAMILMSTVGGASGSLYGTLFLAMSKAARDRDMDVAGFAEMFAQGVASVKQRGRADAGEKTMLDVLIPVADALQQLAAKPADLQEVLQTIPDIAIAGMESTRDMLATKGRASFLGERSLGHIDAGAKTAQLMICAIVQVLQSLSASPM